MSPVEGMYELVSSLKKEGKKLYLLSNISRGFAENYKSVPWIREILYCFDGLVFSGVIGAVKPEREIYEYLLDAFCLKAEECVFVDDSQKNIDGAENTGINGILFDNDVQKLSERLFEMMEE